MQRAQLAASSGILSLLFLIHFLTFVEDVFKPAGAPACSAPTGEGAGAKGTALEMSVGLKPPLEIPNSLCSWQYRNPVEGCDIGMQSFSFPHLPEGWITWWEPL